MKKIASFVLCILIIAASTVFVSAYEGENYILFSDTSKVDIPTNQHIGGDSNGDGAVNLLDVIASIKYILGDKSNSLRDSVDVNSDGTVTVSDALLIIKHVLGDKVGLGELVK